MCGIVGYTGINSAKKRLMSGLSRLEYRGYDSAGISLFSKEGKMITYKTLGRIKNLAELVGDRGDDSTCGIGHTRWATHGSPSDVNAHPHSTEKLSLVHNGIIENYREIKSFLEEKGYQFVSQTDTEIATKLGDYYYQNDPIDAISKAIKMLEGAYAFAIVFADRVGEIFGTRKESPLVVAKSQEGLYLASDMPAILEYTDKYYTLEVGEIVHLSDKFGEKFYNLEKKEIFKEINTSNLSFEIAEKDGFEHFMLKEIYEQPDALKRTIFPRISSANLPDFISDGIEDNFFAKFDNIYTVACGTASYAGTIGGDIVRKFGNINAKSVIASEFRYTPPVLKETDLVILISQSGETADTLAALRLAKEKNVKTLAIVNVKGSAIASEADCVIYTHAGPEIAVASTKAFTVQVSIFYLLAIKIAFLRGEIAREKAVEYTSQFKEIILNFGSIFAVDEKCLEISNSFLDASSMFYIGRGVDATLSLEGALKLKEISYIHCEAYPAGELKHGTISLITQEMPVIALLTDEKLAPKTISNMKEVKARGGNITAIALENIEIPQDSYDKLIEFSCKYSDFAPLYATIPLQLLAYHTSNLKGCDVDKPRNLAKSVTVE